MNKKTSCIVEALVCGQSLKATYECEYDSMISARTDMASNITHTNSRKLLQKLLIKCLTYLRNLIIKKILKSTLQL